MSLQYRIFFIAAWTLVVIQFIQTFLRGFIDHPLLALAYPLVVTPFAFWHGALRYGWARMFVFFIMVFGTGFTFETMSVLTGFPFGNYYYTELLGWQLGVVPLSVMPSYFAFGYISWTLAGIMLQRFDNRILGGDVIIQPLLAAFIMSAWDLRIDPLASTINPMWVWEEGGTFFGVPVSNFLGWYMVVLIFYLMFALLNRSRNAQPTPSIINSQSYWLLAVLVYASQLLDNLTGYLWRENYMVTSLDGHDWWSHDIYGAMLVVALWTVLPITAYAWLQLSRAFSRNPQRDSGLNTLQGH